jgi:hypothetical protein
VTAPGHVRLRPFSALPLVEQRDERLVRERLLALLSGCFAGLGLLLAGLGVYGVVTYLVAFAMAVPLPRRRAPAVAESVKKWFP